jgi:hypothetical protein
MSDPQRLPDDHPRRAQPLQPDKPGSGNDAATQEHSDVSTESTKRALEQEKTALENVRET